jgi:hypothetical protein
MKIPPFKSPDSWGVKSKATKLIKKAGDKNIIGIRVETINETFVVPIIDATLSEDNRRRVAAMEKAMEKSKFMQPSFSGMGYSYNRSYKI